MSNLLLSPLELIPGITLRNRIAMAPMTTWSANDDLTISDEEDAYYRARVQGVGLVITGCTHVSPGGIGFTNEFAAYDDRFIPSLRRLADAAKSGGAPAVLQIFHAGTKAVPDLVPAGDVVGASDGMVEASKFAAGGTTIRGLTSDEITAIIADFGAATRRAIAAGFDGIELHGAHGFLIQDFLSPKANRRTDEWGGDLEGRMRFALAVVAEVKRVIAAEAAKPFVLGYRISPEEPDNDGLRITESFVLIDRLIDAGVSYIHASLANLLVDCPIGEEGATMVERLLERVNGRVPLLAAGQVRTPEQGEQAIALGLPVVAVGQGLVMNPDWVDVAQAKVSGPVTTALDVTHAPALSIPGKLQTVIENTPGWFSVKQSPAPEMSAA